MMHQVLYNVHVTLFTLTTLTAVIDFFAYKPGKTEFLQVLSISGDTVNLMEGGYTIHS